MNKKCLSLYSGIGFMIILMIETTGAALSPSHHNSVPVNQSNTEEKSDDFQQRSDEIVSLDEHLKVNNVLHKQLDSNEKLLNKQLTLNLQNPELNFNKELKSELFSDKQHSFTSGRNSNLLKEHLNALPFSHLISPHLKDDYFDIDRPALGPELAQKYQRELHETLKAHHESLHQALQKKHSNLQYAMNKHNTENSQNLNSNNYGEHSSISSRPEDETLHQNDHVAYHQENNRPQNENGYMSPPSNFNPSSDEHVYGYQGGHNPVVSNGYEKPSHNNAHSHANVYTNTEDPHHGGKSHAHASKEYYYENEKVHQPVPHKNHHAGYGIGEKEGNAVNSNYNQEYPSNTYQGGKDYNHNDNMKPTQYDVGPNTHGNKKQYDEIPHKYQNNKNQYEQTNHGNNDGGYNKNYQTGNNYASQERPVHNNKNNAQGYNPNPYHEHNNQNPHSYSGNVEAGNSKYGKTSSMYPQEHGHTGNNPNYKGRPPSNYNQNNGIKNNSPQHYNSNNGYNNNGIKNYDTYSPDPNSGHMNGYKQNNQGNRQELPKDYNSMQHKQAFSNGQNYNNKMNNNEMYHNGKVPNEYNRGPPVDDRKRYNAPMYQDKGHAGRGYYNNNLPQHPNMNNNNVKNLHNSAPLVPPNKSSYGSTSQSYSNSNSNNQNIPRPYNALNQNSGHQINQKNFQTNRGSPNPHKNHSSGPAISNSRGRYQNNSHLPRQENTQNMYASPQNAKTPKPINAPVVHQIFMSEPLIKPDLFLAGMI